jgi:hypothetical protein
LARACAAKKREPTASTSARSVAVDVAPALAAVAVTAVTETPVHSATIASVASERPTAR